MKINFKKFAYGIAAVAVVAAVLITSHFYVNKVEANASDNLSGWAWSENIGWISFNAANESAPNDYGVRVAVNGAVSGYAWSDNIGWIKFDGANFNKGTGAVTGSVKVCGGTQNGDCAGADRTDGWDGTIKLSGTATDGSPYGVKATGCNWGGWAWGSDVVGWVHFSGSGYGVVGQGNACTGMPGLSCNGSNQCVTGGGGRSCTGDSDCSRPPTNGGGGCFSASICPTGVGLTSGSTPGDTSFFCPSNQIRLSWTYSDPNGNSQAAYKVEIDANPGFSSPLVNTGAVSSGNNFYDTATGALVLGTKYYWKVAVKDSTGEWSDWSAVASFTTPSSCGSAVCGNGIIESGEVCDSGNLAGKKCQDFGFTGGKLTCAPDCKSFDTSLCASAAKPQCSDGIDNDNDGKCDFAGCTIGGVFLPPDPGCSSPNDNDERDPIFKEVLVPFERLAALLFGLQF